MTQKEFEQYLLDGTYENYLQENIKEFFSEHVCIKKGANRHPYADVLHEWIEGVEIQVLLNDEWSDYNCDLAYIEKYVYRIKPQEPVKVGDWVLDKHFRVGIVESITNEGQYPVQVKFFPSGRDVFDHKDLVLWQPKEGEWCWYGNSLLKVTDVNDLDLSKCEPFIGELPSFLKDAR